MDIDKRSEEYEELEQYICSVSHELKEPLQEIALYAKAVEKDSGKFLLPQSQKDLQSIQEICSSTMDMIQLFMKYTKLSSITIRREIIQMDDLISQCFASLTASVSGRQISLETENLPKIIGDRILFGQLITNILSNSIKFTRDNVKARIRVFARTDKETTSYCFEDNGIGFDNKYAAKAFNIFERIHTDSRIAGNGIGLALVKNIVNRFGGDIEISAKENEGCTVTVKLPNKMVISLEKERKIRQDKKHSITIGIIGACSGDYANIAPCRRYAYELAAAEINAAGGINGKEVRLIYRDFHSDLSLVSEIAWELAAVEQVDVLMGGQLSSAREIIRETADKMKIPYFFNALYEGGLADHYTFCISAVPEQNIYPLLTEYVFGYLFLFDTGSTWIPTFIVIVSVPPSMVLMFGPGYKTLLTASILGAAVCTPAAYWISQAGAGLGVPGAFHNVAAMAAAGIIAGCVCRVLPWMQKTEAVPTDNPNAPDIDYASPFWVLRRTIADLTEPQFYGSDIASVFVLAGACIDWFLNPSLLTGGAGMLPAIILSQFISGGLGVFLYTGKYQEKGWYATYVPVVCTAPACILMYGASMPVILVSSILGGVIGAPIAEWLDDRRPDYIHGTVSNVIAMAFSTVITAAVIGCISWL